MTTTKPADEVKVPPRLWISLDSQGRWAHYACFQHDNCSREHNAEYVPATELARVRRETWEKAIEIARYYREEEGDIADQAMRALEAARDQQLPATTTEDGE